MELSTEPFLLTKGLRIRSLKRRRKIWVSLPDGYYDDEETRYPVIYLEDGQNVFEGWKAAFGEGWEAHQTMRKLFYNSGIEQCILVGIEHGRKHRFTEYAPFDKNGEFSKEGNDYADFVANDLKNYIDKRLRTLTDRDNTYIIGSSMGGLIAFYTCFKHHDVFSVGGVFSPSLWAAPPIYSLVRKIGKHYPTRFFLSVGTKEGKSTVNNVKQLNSALKSVGFETELRVVEGGQHTEAFWRDEFEVFYQWLFKKNENLEASAKEE